MLTESANKILDVLSGGELGLIRAALLYRAEHGYSGIDASEFAELYRKIGGESEIKGVTPAPVSPPPCGDCGSPCFVCRCHA